MRHTSSQQLISGGFDPALNDNVRTLQQLRRTADRLGLSHHTWSSDAPERPPGDVKILFILNFSNAQRSYLLTSPTSLCLLYTPENEHFGIVPIEAGACGLPVLATNTGGPLETVVDGKTGILRPSNAEAWRDGLQDLILMTADQRKEMGQLARKRVEENFSLGKLGEEMETACREALVMGDLHGGIGDKLIEGGVWLMIAAGVAFAATLWLS